MMTDNPYKRAEERKKVAPGGEKKPVVVEEKPKQDPANPIAGLVEQKPEGKSYGIYLSNEAYEKLELLAKQNRCSKSKALDTLLRNL